MPAPSRPGSCWGREGCVSVRVAVVDHQTINHRLSIIDYQTINYRLPSRAHSSHRPPSNGGGPQGSPVPEGLIVYNHLCWRAMSSGINPSLFGLCSAPAASKASTTTWWRGRAGGQRDDATPLSDLHACGTEEMMQPHCPVYLARHLFGYGAPGRVRFRALRGRVSAELIRDRGAG